ncbi:hypothetical protein Ae201684P_010112 [Aphanomyces euteiches]|uniref:Secreted protein n=1 Tax=Aphanomyces euteiches TaxID=100861 RepID=A0A6G0X064_9STRA|nr:hypothetical protein Ae201684_009991 [Aphanomyces euteiches]KAH9095902.1 hypothetical protein Ae201684P_010112 [Aphanomyces euteiches]
MIVGVVILRFLVIISATIALLTHPHGAVVFATDFLHGLTRVRRSTQLAIHRRKCQVSSVASLHHCQPQHDGALSLMTKLRRCRIHVESPPAIQHRVNHLFHKPCSG